MNKFFPLPILAALLGCFFTLTYFVSAYAQQHDSPASAQKLNADSPSSFTLPAYATEYFYFFLPNGKDSIPTITLSDSAGIHIQLYDSRETSLKYSISSSHLITFRDSLSAGERYFLKLNNQSSQDKKLRMTLRYTAKPKETVKAKKAVKPKKSMKPKESPKPKKPAKTKGDKKQKNSDNTTRTTNTKKSTKQKSFTDTKNTTSPSQKDNSKLQKSITAIHTPTPHKTTKPTSALTPQTSANSTTTNPISKSNFSLSTHFLRIKAGTSLAIAEALNLPEKSSPLSYQCIFSEKISIQNGILYAKSSGIAVIEITGDNFKSSCTICIQ